MSEKRPTSAEIVVAVPGGPTAVGVGIEVVYGGRVRHLLVSGIGSARKAEIEKEIVDAALGVAIAMNGDDDNINV